MSAHSKIEKDPRQALIEQTDALRAGMLGVAGSGQHMQPMTHYPDWAANQIWFITSQSSDLVQAVRAAPGAKAHYCLASHSEDFHACLRGILRETLDRARLDEIWSPVTAAWFDGGKDDPSLTMLCLDLTDAALWGSTSNALKFGFEIVKANMSEGKLPDLGVHRVLTF